MPAPDRERLEREELESILSSGILAKSPNLEKLLTYICEKYWQGKSAELKEYNLGVEALGRPANFDPAASAIVRVEIHRLRQKLKKFYEDGGARHPLVIRLQPGRYAPQFVSQEDEGEQSLAVPVARVEAEIVPESGPPALADAELAVPGYGGSPPRVPHARIAVLLLSAGAAILIIIAAIGLRHSANRIMPPASANSPAAVPPAAAPGQAPARVIAGYFRKSYIDRAGDLWEGDADFQGGAIGENAGHFIARTADPTLFETYRQGEFSYNIPARPGTYELCLYFVETQFGPGTISGGGETSRIFDVQVNGRTLLSQFDVFADAGGNFIADERVFKDISPAADGFVHISFLRDVEDPFINAIKLVPAPAGKLLPVRLVAQDDSYTDHDGHVWSPDAYFKCGRLALRRDPVAGTSEPGLFAGERYGNFDYAIPVSSGKYAVTLYFAERYFGPGKPGGGGPGSRVFNVICNDQVLLKDFDIFKEAHGAGRALVRTFHGLTANSQGKLLIRFQPVVNYALVDAIRVIDESR